MSASLYLDFVQVLSFQPQQRTLAIPVSCFGYAEGGNRLVPCGVGQWFPPFAFVLRTHTFPRSGFFSSFTDIFLGKNSDLSKKNPRFRFAIVVGISVSTNNKKLFEWRRRDNTDAVTIVPLHANIHAVARYKYQEQSSRRLRNFESYHQRRGKWKIA